MIEVNDESGFEPAPDLEEISELATWVLDDLRVHPQADLSIVMIDEEAMSALHVEWMDLEGPTDVMSFPMDELRPTPLGEEPRPGMLGDIAICPQVAARQALAAGHNTMEEILLLTTHGILHLLGYDHAEPEEKKEMFDLQRRLLLTFLARRPRDPRDPNATIDDIAPTVD
ncbi:rRNA maturation RNase YbeY [Arcanobacterium phocae]|uniref:rRNA maturation RNase YbeY n=1 Tax=Arcanobacterium phocae TaxID=131112 RepID=UPI001C0F1B28|nr:rRNA maturation RNase YbeY [Arcanobacterium phocae]